MKKILCLGLGLCFLLSLWGGPQRLFSSPASNSTAPQAQADLGFNQIPVIFIENQGQADPRVDFVIQGSRQTVYFTATGVIHTFTSAGRSPSTWQHSTLALDFVGARAVKPHGIEASPTRVSYFRGQPDDWLAGVPAYTRIEYPDLWPGIDLVYTGTVNRLKYALTLQPGANPADIRLAYRGVEGLSLEADGRLKIAASPESLHDDRPLAYQDINGQRVDVPVAYRLLPGDPTTYTFQLGAYDPRYPLQIDPSLLVYSGYIGGSGEDAGRGIAVDNSGAAYNTGYTLSSQLFFPTQTGPDLTYNDSYDAFVVKIKPDGSGVVYAGYLGGGKDDYGTAIAVDGMRAAYLTGYTRSDASSFPVKGGPGLVYNGGLYDAFVAKISPDGSGLEYAGYVGGSGSDRATAIALGSNGAAYIAGGTTSGQDSFPVRVGPGLACSNNGSQDAFVARVTPAGSGLEYAGYICGSGEDGATGIAADSSGAAYVTGYTSSSAATFPVRGGPDLTYAGDTDAFIAKVSPGGSQLIYAGYIGGSDWDQANAIAVHASGAAYVTGYTQSSEASFPVRAGPGLVYQGKYDAFVAKVKPDGSGLVYAGYIGGSNWDEGDGIAVDRMGAAYITGLTQSSEGFPVQNAPDLSYNGGADAFWAKINPEGSGLSYAGYIGGSGDDAGSALALGGGAIYITGSTTSSAASFPVQTGPDLSYNGGALGDAFVTKISFTERISSTYLPIILR